MSGVYTYEQFGFAVFTGSEGEDPRLTAWFADHERAEAFVHALEESADPTAARALGRFAVWCNYGPPRDSLLLQKINEDFDAPPKPEPVKDPARVAALQAQLQEIVARDGVDVVVKRLIGEPGWTSVQGTLDTMTDVEVSDLLVQSIQGLHPMHPLGTLLDNVAERLHRAKGGRTGEEDND